MEKRDLINKIYQEYNLELLRNEQIRQISRKVQDGTATYAEAYELAERTGKMIGDIVYENLEEIWDTMSFEDATELIPYSLQKNHDYVTSVTEKIEETINENAKVGLKPLKPDFDDKKAREIASDVANGISKEKFTTECETFSRRTVDKSAQINAAAKERAGLTVKVTRKYDDVGLSNGRTCTWCLARECEDMPYSEAYALGAFERHDGCGCLIEYTNAKGEMTYQTEKGGWHETPDSDKIKQRKGYDAKGKSAGNQIKHTIKPPNSGNVTFGNPVRHSVGAWSVDDFNVTNPLTGKKLEFVAGERPIFPRDHLLAGKGSKTEIRKIDELLEIGGTREGWKHEKAYLVTKDDYGFDAYTEIHWFECEGVTGKHQTEARVRDGEVFFYDIEEWESRWKW